MRRYIRYRHGQDTAWGEVLEREVQRVHDIFGEHQLEGNPVALDAVELSVPGAPSKILGVGLNYRSHLQGRELPASPELFYKPPSALIASGDEIVIPEGATDVHFEGELVIVIGKPAHKASREEAAQAIFGVTCGNDVSDRGWQRGEKKDLQWWRAKGCDTFAPLGPAVVTGIDYGNLKLATRVNGQVVQEGSTADLVHDCPAIVSWASRWVTLMPGDLIYTGTPGSTFALKPGDTVEVEIEGIGVLRNPVV